jgi:hypothetical protein
MMFERDVKGQESVTSLMTGSCDYICLSCLFGPEHLRRAEQNKLPFLLILRKETVIISCLFQIGIKYLHRHL